jgi:hypothetical protein
VTSAEEVLPLKASEGQTTSQRLHGHRVLWMVQLLHRSPVVMTPWTWQPRSVMSTALFVDVVLMIFVATFSCNTGAAGMAPSTPLVHTANGDVKGEILGGGSVVAFKGVRAC